MVLPLFLLQSLPTTADLTNCFLAFNDLNLYFKQFALKTKCQFVSSFITDLLCIKIERKEAIMANETTRQLPDGNLTQDFIICDNSVNRYGWRLLVEGIDTTGFLKNPVCCLQHATSSIPVGKWTNIRVEGDRLIGTVEFDRNDPDAVRLYWKYKDGYMSAVSLNILPITESDDPVLMIAGQTCGTITKSELLEISLVTLPGNKNAVKLSTPDGKSYKLNFTHKTIMAKEEKTVEQLQADLQIARALNADNLIALHVQRGVVQDGEVASLKALALADYENVNKMLNARQPAPSASVTEKTPSETLAEQLFQLHLDRGAAVEGERGFYVNAAKLDYDSTKKALELRPGKEVVSQFLGGNNQNGASVTGGDDRANWTYLDYYKKDPDALRAMATEKPEVYKKLEADFVVESRKLGISTESEA